MERQSINNTPVKMNMNFYNGLLTTPVFQIYQSYLNLNSTPVATQLQQTKSVKKPRVNFHSIDDIVNGGKIEETENNDSGYQSMLNDKSEISLLSCSPIDNKVAGVDETEYHSNDDEPKVSSFINNNKKIRTSFSDQQKSMLEFYFEYNPYPDPKETEDISDKLSLTENVVKVWFQNKRSRDKQRKFSRKSTINKQASSLN